MTKAELIAALEPYPDDTVIFATIGWYEGEPDEIRDLKAVDYRDGRSGVEIS